jgi:hypothetical protein
MSSSSTPAVSSRPGVGAALFAAVLLVVGCVIGMTAEFGSEGFAPRVKTIDALAGLTLGALFVDRLLTFVPVFLVRADPDERKIDLDYLRLGYGALIGGIFVSLTNLQAVEALAGAKSAEVVAAPIDRLFAVLVIAGGVIGLARITNALNPKATDGKKKAADAKAAGADVLPPPPTGVARAIGLGAVALTALLAWIFLVDKQTVALLTPETGADGTLSLVVRFGVVLIGAAIVEQVVERTVGRYYEVKHNKAVAQAAASLVLALVVTWLLDLLLLHNVGFFGAGEDVNAVLRSSTDAEIWFDVFATATIIAAGTKPLHDLGSRLRKVKDPQTGTLAGPPPPPDPAAAAGGAPAPVTPPAT